MARIELCLSTSPQVTMTDLSHLIRTASRREQDRQEPSANPKSRGETSRAGTRRLASTFETERGKRGGVVSSFCGDAPRETYLLTVACTLTWFGETEVEKR